MGKLSYNEKLHVQMLRKQGFGAKAIISSYPNKGRKLSTVKKDCCRVDRTGSAVLRQPGSGRPATAITNENVQQVGKLICLQESDSGTHLSTHQICAELNISQTSVCHIAKRSLHLKSFRRVPAQVINDITRLKRLERAMALKTCHCS